MDSLTTHHLARELDERWRGRRIVGGALHANPRAVVIHVEGSDPVAIDLATPTVVARWTDAPHDGSRLAGWVVREVRAPTDERRLEIALERAGKFRGSAVRTAVLAISVVPTARGAVLRGAGGAVLASIGTFPRRAVEPRPELGDGEVERATRDGDAAALLRGRWMSQPLVEWLTREPALALARYRRICALEREPPVSCDGQAVPVPVCLDPEPLESFIASRTPPGEQMSAAGSHEPADRAVVRMRAELERARQAPRFREAADRLLVLGTEPAPANIVLSDGSALDVGARPGESALEAAERCYRTARSMERALERLPAAIAARETRPPDEHRPPRPATRQPRGGEKADPTRAPGHRRYRSSGGLEILVGKGVTSNDALTFKIAAPNDVWLHARGAAGAHVVLRWRSDQAPPARDLAEAATLAAWHSKSRGSRVVPVDWTRRKHVRRPRGGAPGLVLVTRAETIMARPDDAVERRLRDQTK